MSNQDQASEVIRVWQQRHKNQMDTNPDWAAQNLAGDIHNAGLLAEDLPEPAQSFSDGTKAWLVEDQDGGCNIAAIYICDGEILLHTLTGKLKESPATMRKLALALLAAAQYAEEKA